MRLGALAHVWTLMWSRQNPYYFLQTFAVFGRGVEGTWLKMIQKMVPDEPTSGHVPSTPRIKHCKNLLLNKKKGRRFWQDHILCQLFAPFGDDA